MFNELTPSFRRELVEIVLASLYDGPHKARGRFGPFFGRDAVIKKRKDGLSKRFLQFRLTDPSVGDWAPVLKRRQPQ